MIRACIGNAKLVGGKNVQVREIERKKEKNVKRKMYEEMKQNNAERQEAVIFEYTNLFFFFEQYLKWYLHYLAD